MIAFVLRNWRVLASIVSIIALLGGAGIWIEKIKADAYAAGYQQGTFDATAKCEAEKRAMEDANKKAIDEAAKKLAEAEREITEKETKLDDLLKALDLAADEAEGASDLCLSAAASGRLSAIR